MRPTHRHVARYCEIEPIALECIVIAVLPFFHFQILITPFFSQQLGSDEAKQN